MLSLDFYPTGLLKSEKSIIPAEPQPPVKLKISRHDLHHFEIKSNTRFANATQPITMDLYFFIPSHLQPGAHSKSELLKDFYSRARLGIPKSEELDENFLWNKLSELERLIVSPSPLDAEAQQEHIEFIFQTSRQFGSSFGEYLKSLSALHKKEFLTIHSRANCPPDPSHLLVQLCEKIENTHCKILRIEDVLNHSAQSVPSIEVLKKYVFYLFTSYLSQIRVEFDLILQIRHEYDELKFSTGWDLLSSTLDRLQFVHAKRIERIDSRNTNTSSENRHERHLVELSQLKKFFQTSMFLEISRKETIKRFSEPAAASAAAAAAVLAATLEHYSSPRVASVGIQSLAIILLGVAVYVLKDRLKDYFKSLLTNKLSAVLPDVQQQMIARGQEFGEIKEWFHIRPKTAVEKRIISLRYKQSINEAEKHLPEDVLHYRRVIRIKPQSIKVDSIENTNFQEIVRVNIERYLRRMDDPYKSIHTLDEKGCLQTIKTHRVYHFYLIAQVSNTDTSVYRLVLDKNGIDRIESLD